jgi:O-antigen/teichoic acid export membrane protein
LTANDPSQGRESSTPRGAASLGAHLTHDTAVYTAGAFITFGLALVNVAVVTRFLSPAEFGQLALLLVFAAFLTIIYNVAVLQGTFVWVFGAAGEEDVEDADTPGAADKRQALATGMILTLLICAAGTVLIIPLSPQLAEMLLGDSGQGDLIVLAAMGGAAGAIWRLTSNVLRLERRPYGFIALSAVRPVLVTAAVIALVASGGGVKGAVTGVAIGGSLAIAVSLPAIRRSLRVAFSRSDARMILRRGLIFVPIIVSFWIAQNVDLFMLSRFASDEQVGLYRLAGRVGAFVSYFSSALFMAWTPMQRTSVFAAAQEERGREVIAGTMLIYFVIGGMLLLLGMTATADGLVRIAPPEYQDAAPLIPLLAGTFLAHGLLVAIYRLSSFPGKRYWYVGSAITSAALFLVLALVLIPSLGATGAALSVVVAFLLAAIGMATLSQRGPSPMAIEYGRIAAGLALAAVCMGLARGLGPATGSWQPLVELAALLLYPVLLATTGVIPREEWEAIWEVLKGAAAFRRRNPQVERALRELPPEDYVGLELVIARGWDLDDLPGTMVDEGRDAGAQLVGALRKVAGLEGRTDHDVGIGRYLFSDMPVAERDVVGRELWSGDVDAGELHVLERTLASLRRLPPRAWDQAERDREDQTQPTAL